MERKESGTEGRYNYLNKDFILLWQGHFVSAVGSIVYGIALSFWVLEVTGSTTLMGLASASVMLPRLFLGSFAGVVVDEKNKKNILVFTDLLAGLVILAVAFLGLSGYLRIWMAIGAGILIGSTEAFFKPAVQAAIPLMVAKKDLGRANAAYSAAFSSSNLAGRSIAGFLYQIIGAPMIFLLNGLSYIFSAVSELFIKSLPNPVPSKKKESFFKRIASGAQQVKDIPGLLTIFIIIAFLNFFGFMVVTLYIPFFAKSPDLGPAAYGIVMACSTCGTLFGQLVFSRIEIEPEKRSLYFCSSGVISNLLIVAFPFSQRIPILIILIFLSGLSSAAINIILNTTLQLSVPSEFHGRVFALVGMVGGFLVPSAMVVAGLLAESTNPKILIAICAAVLVILFALAYVSRSVRAFFSGTER